MQTGQTLLVLGGTSALGQAAINLARLESERVLATTRSREKLAHLPSGVQLSFFASAFAFGTEAVPMASIPFQSFVDAAQQWRIQARPAHVFSLERIVEAHELMESGAARGKIVVDLTR